MWFGAGNMQHVAANDLNVECIMQQLCSIAEQYVPPCANIVQIM